LTAGDRRRGEARRLRSSRRRPVGRAGDGPSVGQRRHVGLGDALAGRRGAVSFTQGHRRTDSPFGKVGARSEKRSTAVQRDQADRLSPRSEPRRARECPSGRRACGSRIGTSSGVTLHTSPTRHPLSRRDHVERSSRGCECPTAPGRRTEQSRARAQGPLLPGDCESGGHEREPRHGRSARPRCAYASRREKRDLAARMLLVRSSRHGRRRRALESERRKMVG